MQTTALQVCEGAKLIGVCHHAEDVAICHHAEDVAMPSVLSTPVPWEAPENASQGLEQSCLVAKSGISIVRGDGTAWVGGDNSEGSYFARHEL